MSVNYTDGAMARQKEISSVENEIKHLIHNSRIERSADNFGIVRNSSEGMGGCENVAFQNINDTSCTTDLPNPNLSTKHVLQECENCKNNTYIKETFTRIIDDGDLRTPIHDKRPTSPPVSTLKPVQSAHNMARRHINSTMNSMPSVHENLTKLAKGNEKVNLKQKLSTHQRNLSIDFRSMGILLPPVTHIANPRLNMTHHRNRSLDSVLQKIPEVEISSPSLEAESSFHVKPIREPFINTKINSYTKSQINPSTLISDSSAKDFHQEVSSASTSANGTSSISAIISQSKKHGEVVSLGSDDSGIICESESDRLSLNNIRKSYESIDSSEVDVEEDAALEMLESSKLHYEYQSLKSDLFFYQPVDDLERSTVFSNKSEINQDRKVNAESKFDKLKQNCKSKKDTNVNIDISKFFAKSSNSLPPMNDETSSHIDNGNRSKEPQTKLESETVKTEHSRSEIPFKHFFGVTKNAIFRTAQSIMENHEKKHSLKNKDDIDIKTNADGLKKKELLAARLYSYKGKVASVSLEQDSSVDLNVKGESQSSNASRQGARAPSIVKCFVRKTGEAKPLKSENGASGLLRFLESPVFNIHFAIHYLFYSKEPGVLSFIGNKIFCFPDQDVDLYVPQLIVMYIQMDEVAEVLDPYLVNRCQKSVDFCLKCLWLLEAYNHHIDLRRTSSSNKNSTLSFIKELHPKHDRRVLKTLQISTLSSVKKTHCRSQSDATVILNDSHRFSPNGTDSIQDKIFSQTSTKLCLGDLGSGKAFDNGCICFASVRGAVNGLLGQKTVCCCGAPKMSPQKEFMKALINIGKTLTSLQTKTEKTSALRMFLNLINKNLPARVWLPLYSHTPHHVVRITEEKTAVLNSKDKSPYIIYVEVVEVVDIYSSPLLVKMMPSLRHTKSEENLELKESANLLSSFVENLSINKSDSESANDVQKLDQSECGHKIVISDEKNDSQLNLEDAWSQEDDDITAQYLNLHKAVDRDSISQFSLDSCDSRDQNGPIMFNIGDVKLRHLKNLHFENMRPFSNDPEDPSAAALKEPWHEKEKLIRDSSPYGHLSSWRLLSAIIKCGDDLRQELMATQLLQMFKIIWEEENVDLWVRPYTIVCLSDDSGLIEPIPNTVSLHQIKKNSNKSLWEYFIGEYNGSEGKLFQSAQKNFVQSCAAYCLISYLLQLKDRHNGNILLHADGHIIHIDFGFILSISPKNLGFEQSPFKLTTEFVEVMGGLDSELWFEFNHLLLKGLMAARKHMDRIINLVEIMRSNAQLPCFKNGYSGTIQNLRKRFHMNLTEPELERKVEQLVQDSLKSLSTKLYDGYQYLTNGIL